MVGFFDIISVITIISFFSIQALTDPSALLAHEVAYCLGQMQNSYAIPFLVDTLKNESLDSMVRHEVF